MFDKALARIGASLEKEGIPLMPLGRKEFLGHLQEDHGKNTITLRNVEI